MPAPLISKAEVVERLYETFRKNGYDSASLTELSKATGLGKSSLYHYFPGGKEEMAHAVLDRVDASMERALLAPLQGSGTPQRRLSQALDGLSKVYAHGEKGCLLGSFSTSAARVRFQARLSKTFSLWIGAFASLLSEAGLSKAKSRTQAEEAVLRIQGALILSAGLDDPQPFRTVVEDLRHNLLPTTAAASPRTAHPRR